MTPKKGKAISSRLYLLLVLLIALNLTDIATTIYGLSLGATELNPLFPGNSFITKESLTIKISLPLVLTGLCIVTYRLCLQKGFSKGLWILKLQLLALVGIYTIVVGNNLLGIITTVILR